MVIGVTHKILSSTPSLRFIFVGGQLLLHTDSSQASSRDSLHIILVDVSIGTSRAHLLLNISGVQHLIIGLLSGNPLLVSKIFILTMLTLRDIPSVFDHIMPTVATLVVTSDWSHELTDLMRMRMNAQIKHTDLIPINTSATTLAIINTNGFS
jgi:hypothetical protein